MLMNNLVCIHNDTSSIYREYPSYSSCSSYCPSRWAIPLGAYHQTLLVFLGKVAGFLFRFHARRRPLTDLHDSILCQLVDSIHCSLFIGYWNRFEFEKSIFRLLPVFEDETTKCCFRLRPNRQRNADIGTESKHYYNTFENLRHVCVNFTRKHPN